MSTPKRTIGFRADEILITRLEEMAKNQELSPSEFLRRLVDSELEKYDFDTFKSGLERIVKSETSVLRNELKKQDSKIDGIRFESKMILGILNEMFQVLCQDQPHKMLEAVERLKQNKKIIEKELKA